MVNKKQPFKNKIKDLEESEFEHPDDFFARAQSLEQTTVAAAQEVGLYTSDTPPSQRLSNADEVWIDTSGEGYEGQLAIDVFQDDHNVYVQAIIGGVPPEDVEVHLNNDMLTIKGKRVQPLHSPNQDQYYIQECYWGGFSRSIILPIDIQNEKVEAATENGVLTITLPKSKRPKNSRIPIQEMK